MWILIPNHAELVTLLAGDDIQITIAIQVERLHQIIFHAFGAAQSMLLPRPAALLLQPDDAFALALRIFTGEEQVGQGVAIEVGDLHRLGIA